MNRKVPGGASADAVFVGLTGVSLLRIVLLEKGNTWFLFFGAPRYTPNYWASIFVSGASLVMFHLLLRYSSNWMLMGFKYLSWLWLLGTIVLCAPS